MKNISNEYIDLYNKIADFTVSFNNGNEEAFSGIYEEMLPHIYYFMRTKNVPEDDLVDVAQTIFLTVYKNIGSVESPQASYKWIMSITSNKTADYFRKEAKHTKNVVYIYKEDDDGGVEEQIYRKNHSAVDNSILVPEDIYDNKETQRILYGVLNGLKKEQRDIVILHCIQNFTFKEISEQLGISENTVKTSFYRAINKLEKEIKAIENRDNISLHSVGIVPFIGFMFLFGVKETNVAASFSEGLKSKLIKSGVKTSKMSKNILVGSKMTLVSKIAIGCVAVSITAGTIAVASKFVNNKPITQQEATTKNSQDSETEESSETSTEEVKNTETEDDNSDLLLVPNALYQCAITNVNLLDDNKYELEFNSMTCYEPLYVTQEEYDNFSVGCTTDMFDDMTYYCTKDDYFGSEGYYFLDELSYSSGGVLGEMRQFIISTDNKAKNGKIRVYFECLNYLEGLHPAYDTSIELDPSQKFVVDGDTKVSYIVNNDGGFKSVETTLSELVNSDIEGLMNGNGNWRNFFYFNIIIDDDGHIQTIEEEIGGYAG